jgi:glycosyltransferase involved in cell wall biosynthesis
MLDSSPMADPTPARVTVVIPAYNEAASIGDILTRCRNFSFRVIVIDDGSTDDTSVIAGTFPVTLIRHPRNRGKAAALFAGMTRALQDGAEYVITLDGDGQHRPEDVPRVIEAARRQPGAMIIASRRDDRAGAPPKRYRANRIADFWVSWAAGRAVDDSQSGFRLYPAAVLTRLLQTCRHIRGFVFESELLIMAGRQGVRIVAVAIPSLYSNQARASHFKPVRDITKIVLMVAWKLFSRGMYPIGLWRAYGDRLHAAGTVTKAGGTHP